LLPHDGPMERPAGVPRPHAYGPALVRDAEPFRHRARLPDRLARRLDRDPEDLLGVVLHLTRTREVLRELAIAAPQQAAVPAHYQGVGAGRPLIEGEDGRHARSPPPPPPPPPAHGGSLRPRSELYPAAYPAG